MKIMRESSLIQPSYAGANLIFSLRSSTEPLPGPKRKQERQYTYNVILRRVRESLLHWKSYRPKYYTSVWVHARTHALARGRVNVRVALLIQHSTCMRHIVTICTSSGPTIFFDIISQKERFSRKGHWTTNVCFYFLYKFCLKHFSF